MNIIFENETEFDFTPFESIINDTALTALKSEDFCENAEISFTLTDDEGIREINRKFRNIDKPTDVLSFPLIDFYEFDGNDERTIPLGDIIINIDRAKQQSQSYGHSLEREIAFLAAHSMLHLLGYDHIETKAEEMIMFDKQEIILDKIGLHREHNTDFKGIDNDDRMIFEAYEASKNSYSPYSRFPVGACALCGDDFIRGCNIENSSYPAGICAERTAIFSAVSSGKPYINKIAVYSRSVKPTYPCGICLQVMREFMDGGEVLAVNRFGKAEKFKLTQLLPFGFEL